MFTDRECYIIKDNIKIAVAKMENGMYKLKVGSVFERGYQAKM